MVSIPMNRLLPLYRHSLLSNKTATAISFSPPAYQIPIRYQGRAPLPIAFAGGATIDDNRYVSADFHRLGIWARFFCASSYPNFPHYIPSFERSSNFSELKPEDINYFSSIMPSNQILQLPEDIVKYTTDITRTHFSKAGLVLKPSSVDVLQKILKHCHNRKLAVVPQGGNTGLVGGSVPVFDEIVISMNNFNRIIDFDVDTGALTCESGCVLEMLQRFVESQNPPFIVPLDLGSKGSCTIGGNVSTNAGGSRFMKYGSLLGNVLGLEVVLSDGRILNLMCPLRKDNTGIKLQQLFVGSEGILGIITKVVVNCYHKNPITNVILLQVSSFSNILELYKLIRGQVNDIVSAIEFFDSTTLQYVLKNIGSNRKPFSVDSPFYLLLETSGVDEDSDRDRIELFLEMLLEKKVILDGVIAENDKHVEDLWRLRESANLSVRGEGRNYKFDVTLPLPRLYDLVRATAKKLRSLGLKVNTTDVAEDEDGTASAEGGYERAADESIESNMDEDLNYANTIDVEAGPPAKANSVKSDSEMRTTSTNESNSLKTAAETIVSGGASEDYDVACIGYGHIGDQNIHLNVVVLKPDKCDMVADCIYPWVNEYVYHVKGSISSEHGMGVLKAKELERIKGKTYIELLTTIKDSWDPNGIMNPYKLLP